MSWLLVAPIAVPIMTAALTFLLRRRRIARRCIGVGGAAALLVAAVAVMAAVWSGKTVSAQVGGWPAPFGISLVADLLGAIMVLVTAINGLLVAVYALGDIDDRRERLGFHSLYHIMLAGACGACLTGDVFNLYVWIEVMVIASFTLVALGGEKPQLDGGFKYVAINAVGTLLLLAAIGLLYGMTGTLNMADLHLRVAEVDNPGLVSAVAVLFLIGLGLKAGVFPLFFWLPVSYHTPPVTISAIFSAVLTKVGVYALIRMFTLIFTGDAAFTHPIILWVAAATMVTGVLGAAAHSDLRRILSFHIISQIGYILLGLALFSPLGLIGAAYFLVHNIIAKTNLFLIAGVMNRLGGSFELAAIGGFYRRTPILAVAFLVSALSLGGIPPLSGFWAKLLLVKASLDLQHYAAAGIALFVGLLTIYSMTKIWVQGFWTPRSTNDGPTNRGPTNDGTTRCGPRPAPLSRVERLVLYAPILALGGITTLLGVWAEPFVAAATRTADDLLNPMSYVEAVLEGSR